MCRPTARQRLGKHIPARSNVRDNRMSFARQQRGKQASPTIQAAFSVGSVPRGYKRTQPEDPTENSTVVESEVRSRISGRQPSRIWAWNWIESSLRNWKLQNNGKRGIRLWKEDFMCDLKWQWDCCISVAMKRLVKTENHSACATVNCSVCRIAIALYCLYSRVVWMYTVLINPIQTPSYNPSTNKTYTGQYYIKIIFMVKLRPD
jgi:hypothetical protein